MIATSTSATCPATQPGADTASKRLTSAFSGDELAKGEKTLTYYMFDDAEFGGKLRLKIASASGYSTGKLELKIK
jgi:hypothetical protein